MRIDVAARQVFRAGEPVNLVGRAFDLLLLLASEPGRVFGAAELMAAVWPGRVVEETNLRVQVALLRKRLGADLLVNVPGKGYVLARPAALVGAAAAPAFRGNLPAGLEPLLGREEDLVQLAQLMSRQRLVSLLGTGGIGKTRLAQQLALQAMPGLTDGAWWVDLATQQAGPGTLPRLAQAVAQVLGLQAAGLEGDAAAFNLGQALANCSSLLLVLDNAEHVAAEVAHLVGTLLQRVPGLRVLVTSQQALRLPEEWAYWLGTLAVPPDEATPEQVRSSPAVQLLQRRAQAADQRFVLSDSDLPVAARLVRALDGIALAIEMAAVRLPLMGPQTLLQRLGERLRLLGGDADAALPRHRTLRAALDWSHDLLSAADKQALRRLSVFAAPFRLHTAQQLITDGVVDDVEALRAIHRLVGKSMLQQQPAGPGQAPRLRLLESTRLYAQEALQRLGEARAAQDRHAQTMAELAQQASQAFMHSADLEWSAAWMPDQTELLRGFAHAVEHGHALWAGHMGDALLRMVGVDGRYELIRALAPQAVGLAAKAPAKARALLLEFSSYLPVSHEQRVEHVRQWVQACRDSGDTQRLCMALSRLAWACDDGLGQPALADAAMAEALALEQPGWPLRLRARCSGFMQLTIALARSNAALVARGQVEADALEHMGAWRDCAWLKVLQGFFSLQQGLPEQARVQFEKAVELMAALGVRDDAHGYKGLVCAAQIESAVQAGAAVSASASGAGQTPAQVHGAAAALAQARQRAAEVLQLQGANRSAMYYCAEHLALLACHLGEYRAAATLLAGSDSLRREMQSGRLAPNPAVAPQVRQLLQQHLAGQQLAIAMVEGDSFRGDDLRQYAMRWARQAAA